MPASAAKTRLRNDASSVETRRAMAVDLRNRLQLALAARSHGTGVRAALRLS